ncbi:MAG: ribonuclease III [Lachnospiraceae bacterium]|nr:ribonuclease III [Lachnospiraceae bacterium]
MEEGITLLEAIKQTFDCKEVDIRTYSPLTLAYIGDAIYDLIIRSIVVERANRSANQLHKVTIHYVNARTQAQMVMALEEFFSEEEMAVYHRGRNAKSYTSAKNASIAEYRKATGLEAVFGYLYLQGRMDRLLSLVKMALEKMDMKI